MNVNIFSRVIRQNDLTVCVDSKEDWVHNCIIFRSGGFYQNIFRIFYEIGSDFVCNIFLNCSQSRFLSVLICFICKFGINCKLCTCQCCTVLVCKVFLDQCPCNTYSLVGNRNCTSRSVVKSTIQQNCTINSSTVRTIYIIISGIFFINFVVLLALCNTIYERRTCCIAFCNVIHSSIRFCIGLSQQFLKGGRRSVLC